MADHETIWLDCKCATERTWACDNPFERCEDCGAEPVKFIRFDLHEKAISAAEARGAEREREAILQLIADEIKDFQSEGYATPQPMESFSEVFACNSITAAIRARGENNGQ